MRNPTSPRTFVWLVVFGVALPLSAVVAATSTTWAGEDDTEIERLVDQLGADDFQAREAASTKLAALGEKARAALEKAVRETPSPEIRWRAEQLLRRLAGRDEEKPLGAEGMRPKAPEPGATPPEDGLSSFRDAMERMRKMLEEWHNRPGLSPFGGLMAAHRIVAPGLVLEPQLDGTVKLHVERKDASGTTIKEAYKGHNLKDILARNPQLSDLPGMDELRRREAEASWPGMEDFRKLFKGFDGALPVPNGSGFSFATSQGVEVRQDANGVTVTIRERGENGEETVKEYKGKTVDELKEKHPELRDKIGGFSIRVAPPQIFWPGRRRSPLEPLAPTTPRPNTTGEAKFGLALHEVGEALGSHLGLVPGRGALVKNVLPGSQAEAIGLRRNDIIVKVNGQDVGPDEAGDLLRAAGASNAPVTLEIIRRGAATVLKR